jgi:hypothetical protein
MTNIFEQKFDDADVKAAKPNGLAMVPQDSNESRDAKLPGQRSNPDMAVANIKRPRFGFDYYRQGVYARLEC